MAHSGLGSGGFFGVQVRGEMKKFKKDESVVTKYGVGKVVLEDEDSMTVVVRFPDNSEHALPRFEVKKNERN